MLYSEIIEKSDKNSGEYQAIIDVYLLRLTRFTLNVMIEYNDSVSFVLDFTSTPKQNTVSDHSAEKNHGACNHV